MGKLKDFNDIKQLELLKDMNINYSILSNKVTSMFKWCNLPISIQEDFIEQNLIDNTFLVFFKYNDMLICQKANAVGYNLYNKPTNFRVVSVDTKLNGLKLNLTNCVPVYDNLKMDNSTIKYLINYANKLTEIDTTLSVNLEQLKTPYIIECSENMLTSAKKLILQKSQGVPYIFKKKNKNGIDIKDDIKIFNTNTPNYFQELFMFRKKLTNEFDTIFGIKCLDDSKKERLIADEVNQNSETIRINRNFRLKSRENAVKEINKMFGTSIKVIYDVQEEDSEDVI